MRADPDDCWGKELKITDFFLQQCSDLSILKTNRGHIPVQQATFKNKHGEQAEWVLITTTIISLYLFTPDPCCELTGEGRRLRWEDSSGIYYYNQGGDAIDVLNPNTARPWVNIYLLNL